MTGHGRVSTVRSRRTKDGKGEPLPLSLPSTLLTASQPVAESYRASYLQPLTGMLSNQASCYGSQEHEEHRSKKRETKRFDLRGLTRLTP